MTFLKQPSRSRFLTAFLAVVIVVSSFSSFVHAATPPNIVTYQGRVLNANGAPVADEDIGMVFRLCNTLAGVCTTSGDSCLWESDDGATCDTTDAPTTVSLSDGLFSEDLGSASYPAIPDSVFADNAAVYLEVVIDGETLSPRKRLTAAPYAVNSQTLDGLDSTDFLQNTGGTATGDYDLTGAFFLGASPLVFEGATPDDGFETTFAFTDPTADRTVTFQNLSGTVAYLSDIVASTWEVGVNGIFEDDDDILIGATSETLVNTAFSLSGNDLFVAGDVGVEGSIFTDSGIFIDKTVANSAGPSVGIFIDVDLETGTAADHVGVLVSAEAPVDAGDAFVGFLFQGAQGSDGLAHVEAFRAEPITNDVGTAVAFGAGPGYDLDIRLTDPTPTIAIDGGSAVLSFTDGFAGNTLMTLTDAGTVGDVGITGELSVDGDATFNSIVSINRTISDAAGPTGGLFIDLDFETGTAAPQGGVLVLSEAPVDSGDSVTGFYFVGASGGGGTEVAAFRAEPISSGAGSTEAFSAGAGYDTDLRFSDTTPIISLDGGDAVLSFTDGTSTLMTLTDAGSTGDLLISGDLTVNGGTLTSSGSLDIAPTSGLSFSPGGTGDITLNADDESQVFITSAAIANSSVAPYGLLNLDLNLGTGTSGIASAIVITTDAPVDSGDEALGIASFMTAGGAGTQIIGLYLGDVVDTPGVAKGIVIGDNYDRDIILEDASPVIAFGGTLSFGFSETIVFGETGDITMDGDLDVNGGDISSTGSLTLAPTSSLDLSPGGTGDLTVNIDNDSQMFITSSAITTSATPFGLLTIDVNLGTGTSEDHGGILIAMDAPVDSGDSVLGLGVFPTAGPAGTEVIGLSLDPVDASDGRTIGVSIGEGYDADIEFNSLDPVVDFSGSSSLTFLSSAGSIVFSDAGGLDMTVDGNIFAGTSTVSGVNASFTPDGDDIFASGDIAAQDNMYADAFVAGDSSTTFGNGVITTTSGDLTVTPGGSGDFVINTDNDSAMRFVSTELTNTSTTDYGILQIELNMGSGTVQNAGAIQILMDSAVDNGDTSNGLVIVQTPAAANTNSTGIVFFPVAASAGTTTAIEISDGYDAGINFSGDGSIVYDGTFTIGSGLSSFELNASGDVEIGGDFTVTGGNITAPSSLVVTATSGTIDLEASSGVTADIIGTTTTNGVCHSGGVSDTDDVAIVDCSGAPSDIAEWYETVSGVSEGDIVVVTPTTFTYEANDVDAFTGAETGLTEMHTISVLDRASQPYQGTILGVVSTSPAQTYGEGVLDTATNPQPIALAGRVPTRVSDENGPIAIGDAITSSSTPGVGMKSSAPGKIVGYALEPWNDAGTGRIMVYLSPTWDAGNVIGTDGTSTVLTSTVVLAPLGTASADTQGVSSNMFALRGSAWDGGAAQDVAMSFTNEVTNASSYRLSIKNTSGSEVAYVSSSGVMKAFGDLVIGGNLYPSDRGSAQTSKYIYYDGDAGPGGDMMRTNAAGWSTGSYDFAEMFPSNEALAPGDVVAFGGSGALVRRATGDDSILAGIVSTRPGFLAGENLDGHYPIALAGRVPTRVNLEAGSIAVGDPLTASSTSGEAMRATEAGGIVGYALEPYDGSGEASILAYVNAGYWAPSMGTNPLAGTSNGSSGFSGGGANLSVLNMEGDIYLGGNSILNVGRIAGLSGTWSIEPDGTIKTTASLQTIIASYQGESVTTTAITSRDVLVTLSGTTELQQGSAVITFEDLDPSFNDITSTAAPIRVIVTPSGPVSLYVSQKSNNGFTVQEIGGSSSGVAFDWQVTAYRKDFEPEEPGLVEDIPEEEPVNEEGDISNDPEEEQVDGELSPPSEEENTPESSEGESGEGVVDEPLEEEPEPTPTEEPDVVTEE